jgi:BirA family biotin operon repressor/biotin-[acetyl-CoA-carboxylase] ligase
MGIIPSLTPSLIGQCLLDEEQPFRRRLLPEAVVDAICRYGAPVGSALEISECQGRCMDLAREKITEFEVTGKSFPSGMGFVARELTAGKGRFQRLWHAPRGGLWLTLVLVDTLLPETSRLYPLAAGVACGELLRQYGIDAHIRWVNDVQLQGRKIAGILSETFTGPVYRERYVLIGIGLNVNNDVFPGELAPIATSMKEQLGSEQELALVAARLFAKLAWNIGLLHYQEALRFNGEEEDSPDGHDSLIIQAWKGLTDSIGRSVWFGFDVQKNPQYRAQVLGIQHDGGLILKLAESEDVVVEYSGEIRYLD